MKKSSFRYPSFFIGLISLLVVIIVLVLTCFAVLSYVNARADNNLAKKTAQSISDYYQADKIALEKADALNLKTLDEAYKIIKDYENADISYISPIANVSFEQTINSNSVLSVEIVYDVFTDKLVMQSVVKWNSESGKEAQNADQ